MPHSPEPTAAPPRCIYSASAPPPIGDAYCQATVAGHVVQVSGLGGITLEGEPVSGAGAQAALALSYLRVILEEAGTNLRHVTRTSLYYTDLQRDAGAVNAAYLRAFSFPDGYRPARMIQEVQKAPLAGSLIWIDAVAVLPSPRSGAPA